MFTVCPKCALTLVVTAADLRVAQGYVRCGRCSSVFNAIARLTEERGAAAAAAGAPAVPAASQESAPAPAAEAVPEETAAPAAAEAPSDAQESETALEFNPDTTDVNSVFVQAAPDPQWTAATGSFKARIASAEAAPAAAPTPPARVDVEIDAEDFAAMLHLEPAESPPPAAPDSVATPASAPPPPAAAPEPDPEPVRRAASTPPPTSHPARPVAHQSTHVRPEAQASARRPRASAPPEPLAREVRPAPAERATAAAASPEEGAAEAEEAEEPGEAAPRAWLQAHGWTLAVALALVVLLAQILNHNRDELATSARFNHALTKLYGALGIKLFPRWDLRAYDVRQLGAEADPAGAGVITVRASIKNAAPEPQPLPLLRVTLQDRYGNRIAMRDVAPHSYLPQSIPPASFLAAGQRIDAEMGFADPGADAVGFEIDACLPARGGVACANDVALR